MKRSFFFALLLWAGYSRVLANNFTITIYDAGTAKWVHFFYERGTVFVHDSIALRAGRADYSGDLTGAMTRVTVGVDGPATLTLVADPGDRITVEVGKDPGAAKIVGSPASLDYRIMHDRLGKLIGKPQSSLNVLDSFLRSHPASEGTFLAMTEVSAGTFFHESSLGVLDSLQRLFSLLPDAVRVLPAAREYAAKLEKAKHLQVGAVAPDFSTTTIDDKSLKLSDLRGKYVLVDFWASWCIPCRHEFPYLKKAYARFHANDFEIVGYSIDNDRSLWESAVSNDDVGWVQVSDLKGYTDPIAQEYDIQGVPSNWLLDPQGKIVARNLRGEDVEKILGEYIK